MQYLLVTPYLKDGPIARVLVEIQAGFTLLSTHSPTFQGSLTQLFGLPLVPEV
jgi:hypothetical protein